LPSPATIIFPLSIWYQGLYPRTATNTAVSSQLLRPMLSTALKGILIRNTSFTGLLMMDSLCTSGNPVLIFTPISNPLSNTGVGQFSNTNCEAIGSRSTLNSLPEGNLPAMHTSCLTFFATRLLPFSFEYLSAGEIKSAYKLVRNPVVMIVTL